MGEYPEVRICGLAVFTPAERQILTRAAFQQVTWERRLCPPPSPWQCGPEDSSSGSASALINPPAGV